MRVNFRNCVRILQNVHNIWSSPIRAYEQSVLGEYVTELNERTLTGRLLIYLNGNIQKDKNQSQELIGILKNGQIQTCNTNQMISSLKLLGNRDYFNDKLEFVSLLSSLDDEFSKRLNNLDTKGIFDILHSFMNTIPNRIIECSFYKFALKKLLNQCSELNKNDLVQLIFFIGLQKKSRQSHKMLNECMLYLNNSFIENLTCEEICIICNSAFKTSTKITKELFLKKVVQCLNDNLFLLKDPALFITLIKTLRHNRYLTDDLLAMISCTIFFNKTIEYYSFSALCHILALYSDFLYHEENLITVLANKSLEILKNSDYVSRNEYFLDNPRLKDIKRLLWSLSNLNYKHLLSSDVKNVLIPSIIKRIDVDKLDNDCVEILEIISYLWMLNYRAYELVPYVLTKEKIEHMKAVKLRSYQRLNLLLSCIYFEDRKLFRKLNIHPEHEYYDMKFQLEKRPTLQKLLNNLKQIGVHHEINKFEISCQMPGINIIGITGYKKNIYKAVHIEILDGYTTLKNNEDMPTGLMQLKLRLLDASEEGVIVLSANELDYPDDELEKLLIDEFELVC